MTITGTAGVRFAEGQAFYDKIMTDDFLPIVADARNNSRVTLSLLPGRKWSTGGRFIVFPARTTRNEGHAFVRAGSGKLPDPGNQGAALYAFAARVAYGRVKIDGHTFRMTEKDAVRFLDVVDMEVNRGLFDDMLNEHNRIANNDGSGRLAQVTAGGGTTTLTLQINQGIESPTTCNTPPTQWIRAGMKLLACTDAGASGAKLTVVSVLSNTQITVDVNTAANGDWLVRLGTLDAADGSAQQVLDSSYKAEPMGLEGIFSDTDPADGTGLASPGVTWAQTGQFHYGNTAGSFAFQGIDADTNTFNQCPVLDNAGTARDISEGLMQQAFDTAMKRNNGQIDFLLSNYEARSTYATNVLIPAKRFNNTTEASGGLTAIDFNGKPWYADRDCYRNRIKFVGLEGAGFARFDVEDLQFLREAGSPIWRWLNDDDAYWCALTCTYTHGVEVRERVGAHLVDLIENT